MGPMGPLFQNLFHLGANLLWELLGGGPIGPHNFRSVLALMYAGSEADYAFHRWDPDRSPPVPSGPTLPDFRLKWADSADSDRPAYAIKICGPDSGVPRQPRCAILARLRDHLGTVGDLWGPSGDRLGTSAGSSERA